MPAPLKICLDARIPDRASGGVQQFVLGLARGLSRLTDGDEQYLFLSDPRERGWLAPHLSGPCAPLDVIPGTGPPPLPRRAIGALLTWGLRKRIAAPLARLAPIGVPASDGAAERAGADVVHLTVQSGFTTSIPTIYQPFDLQHYHLPQFFTPLDLRWREVTYPALARASRRIAVMSSWVKEDVVRRLGVPERKVQVIPWGPVTEEYPVPTAEDLAATRKRLSLPAAFAVYPAQTFPHKNHLGLVEAVARAREQGTEIHVVCPGQQNDSFRAIERRIAQRGVRTVRFPGFVSPVEIRCLYRLARFLVFPTLFEGGGMPVFEAFAAGLPVACANVTGLPKQAGDAAILFDPRNPAAIAEAMMRLWHDAGLRAELARRGADRVRPFTWDRTARTYRALYREVAREPLSEEDRALLDAPADT